ncbi:hypothetical protein AAD001_08510 [Colwelliaceae bacterium 6471]
MAQFHAAQITSKGVKIDDRKIDKSEASQRIRQGKDVWGSKSNANTLAESLSEGQGNMRHAPHVIGGYNHYHDISHHYTGHIFYGEPH